MCGIFGFLTTTLSEFDQSHNHQLADYFLRLSETRGKDASGLALIDAERIRVLKRPVRGRDLTRTPEYRELWQTGSKLSGFLGHARMVTNGSEETHDNNQPVLKNGCLCLQNGIVVNDGHIWPRFPELQREHEVDTEVLISLFQHFRSQGQLPVSALVRSFREAKGANSIALTCEDLGGILIATTNGSLYFALGRSGQELIFASERYILKKIISHPLVAQYFLDVEPVQVRSGQGYVIAYENLSPQLFGLHDAESAVELDSAASPRQLVDLRPAVEVAPRRPDYSGKLLAYEKLLAIDERPILALRRCSRCLLPETFPFIQYDLEGVCNFCHNYAPYRPQGHNALQQLVESLPRKGSEAPNVLAPLSGGRDSSYAIHYMKTRLGMNPVAYTYDWGMVTDLARRNVYRVCGELGVEHILISADIRGKRRNIRKNVLAWLRRPELGTVPLFMAGDKQFFYYANMLKQQMDLDLILFSMNPLERTDFKSGFTGTNENYSKEKHYHLSARSQLKQIFYYARQVALNPAFINSSVADTLFGYVSYYLIPHEYEIFYDYIPWNEAEIEQTLQAELEWETASDTETTWRIGDGTASFYNYIYYRMAGFTENDTQRSNLIREGALSRDEAWEIVHRDNQPRLESILWYCDTIGIDFEHAIERINAAPRLY